RRLRRQARAGQLRQVRDVVYRKGGARGAFPAGSAARRDQGKVASGGRKRNLEGAPAPVSPQSRGGDFRAAGDSPRAGPWVGALRGGGELGRDLSAGRFRPGGTRRHTSPAPP